MYVMSNLCCCFILWIVGIIGTAQAALSPLLCDRGCPSVYMPVCGHDGRTYANVCTASCQRIGIARYGVCAGDALELALQRAHLGSDQEHLSPAILTRFENQGFTYAARLHLTLSVTAAGRALDAAEARTAALAAASAASATSAPAASAAASTTSTSAAASPDSTSTSHGGKPAGPASHYVRITRDGHVYRSSPTPSSASSASTPSKSHADTLTNSFRPGDSDDPFEPSFDLESIRRSLAGIFGSGGDPRRTCPVSSSLPFSSVGQINIGDSYGNYICSGSLIGPDVVLTAAHCVFSRSHGAFYGQVSFAPGRYHDSYGQVVSPHGSVAMDHVTVYSGYSDAGSADPNLWDIAVIKLQQPVGDQAGWMGIYNPNQSPCYTQTSFALTTAGYPAEYPSGSCLATSCQVTVKSCTDDYLYHYCATTEGDSGSSMWVGGDSSPQVRAVHNIEWDDNSGNAVYNTGTAITPAHYAAIMQWIGPSFAGRGGGAGSWHSPDASLYGSQQVAEVDASNNDLISKDNNLPAADFTAAFPSSVPAALPLGAGGQEDAKSDAASVKLAAALATVFIPLKPVDDAFPAADQVSSGSRDPGLAQHEASQPVVVQRLTARPTMEAIKGATAAGQTTRRNRFLVTSDDASAAAPSPQLCGRGCSSAYVPVCGHDGRTYANECTASCQGIGMAQVGVCEGDALDLALQRAHLGSAQELLSPAILTRFENEGFAYAVRVHPSSSVSAEGRALDAAEARAAATAASAASADSSSASSAASTSPTNGSFARPASHYVRITRDGHVYRSSPTPSSASSDSTPSKSHADTLTSSFRPGDSDDPLESTFEQESVRRSLAGIFGSGGDPRRTCPVSSSLPFSSVGQINIGDSYGNYICSGSLIGPDVVLTAAHCVFSRSHGAFYGQVSFAPGRYCDSYGQVVSPHGSVAMDHVTVYSGYSDAGSADPNLWDIAVIKLQQPVGDQAGWMGVYSPDQSQCNTETSFALTTAGYPAEYPSGSCLATSCQVTVKSCTDDYLYHYCATTEGDSGSSMWVGGDSSPQVRAVHNIEWDDNSGNAVYNTGTAITPAHYAAIMQWIGPSFAGRGGGAGSWHSPDASLYGSQQVAEFDAGSSPADDQGASSNDIVSDSVIPNADCVKAALPDGLSDDTLRQDALSNAASAKLAAASATSFIPVKPYKDAVTAGVQVSPGGLSDPGLAQHEAAQPVVVQQLTARPFVEAIKDAAASGQQVKKNRFLLQ